MKYVSFILLTLLCGCNNYRLPLGGLPTPNNYMNTPPPGPAAFRYGWMGGCNTAASPNVSAFYTDIGNIYVYKDYKFAAESPDYEIGWQTGFWYCVRMSERSDGLSKERYEGLI